MRQAADFNEECEAVNELVNSLSHNQLKRQTQFKQWTIEDILRHLAVWDSAARLTVEDQDAFTDFLKPVPGFMLTGQLRDYERQVLTLEGRDLVVHWWRNSRDTAERFTAVDPRMRLRWGGPDLSARSLITSRLMETWAHAQAIYDALDKERVDGDRIENIVYMGINTFSWTFTNRGIEPPGPIPSLRLLSPSGKEWLWDSPGTADRITGAASEFCQVVTQVRNIQDTRLVVEGSVARRWMEIAQCFAGPPSDPPQPGERFRAGKGFQKARDLR